MDKFLKGEENNWKEHKFYFKEKFDYIDKSFPTLELAAEVFHPKPEKSAEAKKH
jgi:hypothetical protein